MKIEYKQIVETYLENFESLLYCNVWKFRMILEFRNANEKLVGDFLVQ